MVIVSLALPIRLDVHAELPATGNYLVSDAGAS